MALDFDPTREPAAPKDAATVLIARDGVHTGIELFFVRRHARSAFLGGAVVFPGGKLDAADADPELHMRAAEPHGRSITFANSENHARALAWCACRETLEEAALLPATTPISDDVVQNMQQQLNDKERDASFAALLMTENIEVDVAQLVPFARWITPTAERRRYDTRFYLLRAPRGQQGRHDAKETTMGLWAAPTRMIDAHEAGDVFLAPPTLRALELLIETENVHAAIAVANAQSLLSICPVFVPGDEPYLALPGDPAHEIGEPRVDGAPRFSFRNGRFVSG